MDEIFPDKTTVLKLLDSETAFLVPKFQRGFAWDKDNFSELLDDLKELVESNKEHFLGTMIFCDADEFQQDVAKMRGVKYVQVIDGQQRLTAFTILIRVIYDLLVEAGKEDLAERYYEQFIVGETPGGEKYFKLVLGKEDREFFENYVQKEETQRAGRGYYRPERRIVSAYNFLYESLKEAANRADLGDYYKNLLKRIEHKAVLVVIKVPTETDAYTIFETINSRGEKLAPSELLKNFIFSVAQKIDPPTLQKVQEDWDAITTNLRSTKEVEPSQFIRHYWISTSGPVREKQLYKTIKETYADRREELVQLANNLYAESALYVSLYEPSSGDKFSELTAQLMLDINGLGIKQCYPLILAALVANLPDGGLKELLGKIIAVSLRRGIADRNPNELEFVYSNSASQLRRKGVAALSTIINQLERANVADQEFKKAFLEQDFSPVFAKFILKKLEDSLSTGEKQAIRPTLEHILPQKPDNLIDWGGRGARGTLRLLDAHR